MGMNPDTNRFEPLTKEEDDRIGDELKDSLMEEFQQMIKGKHAGLVRPDGTGVPKHWTVFAQDELVVIKDYTFKVAYIGETSILFEPVGPVIVKPDADDG